VKSFTSDSTYSVASNFDNASRVSAANASTSRALSSIDCSVSGSSFAVLFANASTSFAARSAAVAAASTLALSSRSDRTSGATAPTVVSSAAPAAINANDVTSRPATATSGGFGAARDDTVDVCVVDRAGGAQRSAPFARALWRVARREAPRTLGCEALEALDARDMRAEA